MNTETVLARIVAKVTEILKTVVSQIEASDTLPRLYDLEEQTQVVLPQIGQVLLQELVSAEASWRYWAGTARYLWEPAALSRPIAAAFGPDQCWDHSTYPAGLLPLPHLSPDQLSSRSSSWAWERVGA